MPVKYFLAGEVELTIPTLRAVVKPRSLVKTENYLMLVHQKGKRRA